MTGRLGIGMNHDQTPYWGAKDRFIMSMECPMDLENPGWISSKFPFARERSGPAKGRSQRC